MNVVVEARIAVLAASMAALTAGAAQAAQPEANVAYPSRPMRFVVPFAPGGGADFMARIAGAKVAESTGQQVVIDNRGGAGGNIAAEMVAKSAPDGYTLFLPTVATAISTSLYRKLPYDLLKDFAPVSNLTQTPFILVVHPSSPVNSVKELIALARSQPGQLTYGSSGNGGPSHLGTELFKSMAGIDVRHVPYKGGGPATVDLISGQINILFNTPPTLLPHIKSGRVKPLAIASLKRVSSMPDLPTVSESGVPGYELSTWYGLLVPAGTPAPIVNRLHGLFVAALNAPDVRERLARENLDVIGSSPAEFGAYLRTELPKWAKVVKASGARVD